jgi:hypothetical protein
VESKKGSFIAPHRAVAPTATKNAAGNAAGAMKSRKKADCLAQVKEAESRSLESSPDIRFLHARGHDCVASMNLNKSCALWSHELFGFQPACPCHHRRHAQQLLRLQKFMPGREGGTMV